MTEGEHDGFVYRFNVTDDLPYLASLPKESLWDIEARILDVIYESFIVPGDEDYFAARLLAIRGFHRAFYWSASQCIEKYLKAFLLFRGKSVRKLGHSISTLLKEATKVDPAFSTIDLSPHADVGVKEHEKLFAKIPTLIEFRDTLDRYGSPDNRYNSYGASFSTGHVFALDSLAAFIRHRVGCPSIRHSLLHKSNDTQGVFYEKNPWFGRPVPVDGARPPIQDSFYRISGKVPMLAILVKNRNGGHFMHSLTWLRRNMKLPEDSVFD